MANNKLAKYFLPVALYMLSSTLNESAGVLGEDVVERLPIILRVLWGCVVAAQLCVLVLVRRSVGRLVDDGTLIRVAKTLKKRRGKKRAKRMAALQQEEEKEGLLAAAAADATAGEPTAAETASSQEGDGGGAGGGAPAAEAEAEAVPSSSSTPPALPQTPPAAASLPYEDLTIPQYDQRMFSQLVTRWIIETVLVGIFNVFPTGNVSSLGLLFGILSSPLGMMETPLVRVHLLFPSAQGEGSGVERPFTEEEKGIVAEMKEQWGQLKNVRETARKMDSAAWEKERELLQQLMRRKGGGTEKSKVS